MELNYFKDVLFDVINDSGEMKISDIEADDGRNMFMITMLDGSKFVVVCKKVSEKELHKKRIIDLTGRQ